MKCAVFLLECFLLGLSYILFANIANSISFLASMGVTLHGLQIQTNFLIIPVLIIPASVAYAIAKHDLFDVDVYINRPV